MSIEKSNFNNKKNLKNKMTYSRGVGPADWAMGWHVWNNN